VRIESDGSLKDAVTLIVMVQAFIEYAGSRLGINAFDQPGVERGKQIARELSQKN
jgi:glucose-6-phosphate isomerase